MKYDLHFPLGTLLFAAASVVLAIHPVIWLVRTWTDPSYGSFGFVFIGLAFLLVIASLVSGSSTKETRQGLSPIYILLTAGLIRLASQLFAINFLGGIALCLDIYAVLKLLNLNARPLPVSPFWIAGLIFLSLPIERLLQRFGGLFLQDASAAGACQTLGLYFHDLKCAGTLLTVRGHEVLVDLPCSGTAALMITLGSFVALCAIQRPRPITAISWLTFALILSVFFNSIRISLLAFGIVYKSILPFDVMSEPAHGLIGLTTLGLSLLPLFLWFRPTPWHRASRWVKRPVSLHNKSQSILGACALCAAVAIVSAPRTAWDISGEVQPPFLPTALHSHSIETHPLSAKEQQYFEAFGGVARKASYGAMGVTIVRTTSPLRHLHSPQECLKGLGFDVTFKGTSTGSWPSSIYTATDTAGQWIVAVTFAANDGFVTANIAQVIWHWLKNPNLVWSSYQRITPHNFDPSQRHQLEASLMASLDVPMNPQSPQENRNETN